MLPPQKVFSPRKEKITQMFVADGMLVQQSPEGPAFGVCNRHHEHTTYIRVTQPNRGINVYHNDRTRNLDWDRMHVINGLYFVKICNDFFNVEPPQTANGHWLKIV